MQLRRYVFSTLAVVLGAGVVGCGSTQGVSLGGTTTSTGPGPRPTAVPADGLVKLTAADSGATVAVRVGTAVELTLAGTTTQWTPVAVSPEGLLASGPAATQPPHGVLARWTTTRSGTVRLTSTGTAWCPPNPQPVACPMWARPFDVTLVIS